MINELTLDALHNIQKAQRQRFLDKFWDHPEPGEEERNKKNKLRVSARIAKLQKLLKTEVPKYEPPKPRFTKNEYGYGGDETRYLGDSTESKKKLTPLELDKKEKLSKNKCTDNLSEVSLSVLQTNKEGRIDRPSNTVGHTEDQYGPRKTQLKMLTAKLLAKIAEK